MACPFFVPIAPWPDSWTGPRRVPLGEPYRGRCSRAAVGVEIDESVQASRCNFGYARGRCATFPDDAGIDAVRFSMVKPDELIWVTEREHSPVEHGTGSPPEEYAALAEAFLRSYRGGKCPQGVPST